MRRKWIITVSVLVVIGLMAGLSWAEDFDWQGGQGGQDDQYWTPPEADEGAPSLADVDKIIQGQKNYRLHKVSPGENLHLLAAYYYGNARAWRKIYFANQDKIRNPNVISKGTILKIEVSPDWKPRFPLEAFMEMERKRKETVSMPARERPKIIRDASELVIPVIIPEELVEETDEVPEEKTTRKRRSRRDTEERETGKKDTPPPGAGSEEDAPE